MPLYQYLCPSCYTQFDRIVPYALADQPVSCPICRTTADRQLGTVAHIILGQGYFRPMDWGKHPVTVNYPDHTTSKTHNEMYEDGGL